MSALSEYGELSYDEFRRKLARPIPFERPSLTFGQTIRWTEFGGIEHALTVNGFMTPGAATRAAIDAAKELGWTPRRWWQFWRYSDTKVTHNKDSRQ
jgi:hypothetical protein